MSTKFFFCTSSVIISLYHQVLYERLGWRIHCGTDFVYDGAALMNIPRLGFFQILYNFLNKLGKSRLASLPELIESIIGVSKC